MTYVPLFSRMHDQFFSMASAISKPEAQPEHGCALTPTDHDVFASPLIKHNVGIIVDSRRSYLNHAENLAKA